MKNKAEHRRSLTEDELIHEMKVAGLLSVWKFVKETQFAVGYTPSQLKEMRDMMRAMGALIVRDGWTLHTPQEMEVVEDLELLG